MPESSCSVTCKGNPTVDLSCGAVAKMSIYQVKSSLINTTKPISTLGSFSNMSSTQLNNLLTNTNGSMTGCLLSCSHHGSCSLNTYTNQIECTCDQYYTGDSCQYDSRPCSSSPCLRGGNCTNIITENTTIFTCECGSLYYGVYCENEIDLCLNSTCAKGQGYCKMVNSAATCVCLNGYEGEKCDQKSSALKTQSTIVSMASILAFVILGSYCFMILFMDYLKYFVIKDKRTKESKKKNNSKKSIKKPNANKIETEKLNSDQDKEDCLTRQTRQASIDECNIDGDLVERFRNLKKTNRSISIFNR